MLSVYGVVGIPRDSQIKEYATEKGATLYFDIMSQDVDSNTWHRYKARLWVSAKDKEGWLKDISPRSIWYIEGGKWSARKDKEGRVNNILQLDNRKFIQMDSSLWLKQEEK